MLRLPAFELLQPTTVSEAVARLTEYGEDALLISGGTDLLPNMKHELFTPKVLVSLAKIEELHGVRREEDGTLVLGAMTSLDALAAHEAVRSQAPALAQAASLVAGPQLRSMGTLGGNVMLDTRCRWYNQTYFWRKSLGFCLKKDGTKCHVVESGSRCVAAASNDSAPALMTLGARLAFEGPEGRREIPIDELWRSDGVHNKNSRGEVLVEVRVPPTGAGHRGAYGKLRDRGEIDFPLFGVAVRLEVDDGDTVQEADAVTVALAAKPVRLRKTTELLLGTTLGSPEFEQAVEACAEAAYRQLRPLDNVPGDADYRREMVPVYTRHTLRAAARGEGPIHQL